MTLIPELERELEAMARRRAAAPTAAAARPARRRGRLSRRTALVLVGALMVAATAALAAGGVIPIGAPVREHPGTPVPRPDVGDGTVVPGTVRVLGLRVPDPDGGPAWGLRLTSTTRGAGCLQIGHVVSGRLGVLGRDGLFGDDGAFHPYPANASVAAGACAALDAKGRLFTSAVVGAMPVSGLADGACVARGTVVGDPRVHECPDADLRVAYAGTLGPGVRSVTYVGDDGAEHVAPVQRPYGAYLLIRRRDPRSGDSGIASGTLYGTPDPEPLNTPITRIAFADGRTCAVTPSGFRDGPASCPLPGFAPLADPHVTEADVRTPVRARVEVRDHRHVMVIRFRARVATRDVHSIYEVSRHLVGAGTFGMGTVSRDIREGQVVEAKFYGKPRRGLYRGRVLYTWLGGGPAARRREITVGTWSLRIP